MEQKLTQVPEERILGGDPGTGQDVTIILVPNGGCKDQTLALIHLHSDVLSTHSKYFNACLSDRWTNSASVSSQEFVLEVQADVGCYFDCFSFMYSRFAKKRKLQGVKYCLEVVKVASQIDFQDLIDHILLYLSTIAWSDEDEIWIREYSSSPDFPRNHAEELVARLGLDESEEDRQKQLCDFVRQCVRFALREERWNNFRPFFTELLLTKSEPSNFHKTVVMIVSREAKDMFTDIEKAWDENPPRYNPYSASTLDTTEMLEAMCWALETLLSAEVAEELIRGVVYFSAIPKYITSLSHTSRQGFAELVHRIYQEVIDGHLLLRMPERVALLTNWRSVGSRSLLEEPDDVTEKLFSTLPLKQQIEFINLQREDFHKYISPGSLISILSKKSWPARELEESKEEQSGDLQRSSLEI